MSSAQWTDLGEPHSAYVREAMTTSPKGDPGSAGPLVTVPAMRSLPIGRQVDLAFEALFGDRPREIRSDDRTVYSYSKAALVWSDFGPILIAEGQADASPNALGTLGIFYLREDPGPRFEQVRRWPEAIDGNIMGNPPEWKVRGDMGPYPVVESSSGGVWQGYACAATTLTELSPGGPKLLAVFDSHYSSEGAEGDDGETYDGSIVNVVPGRSFDVEFAGTRKVTQHFVRGVGVFVRVPQPGETLETSAIPTC